MLCARCHLDALLVVRRDLLLTSPCVEYCTLVIRRGLFATFLFVEGRSLVPSFANVIGVLPLLQASEFYHVRLMKTLPKLPFIVVIVIFFISFSSRCSCLFFVEYLLYTQQNIYQNIALLKILWNYLSNEWSFALNGVQTRELWPFYFSTACCPENFRGHDFWCFGHNFLWETSIDFILDLLESELRGAFEYPKICCFLLLRLSRILMITMTSYESTRRCRWSWSCDLRNVLLCILGFKVITIDSSVSSMAPMVCLHGSCFA